MQSLGALKARVVGPSGPGPVVVLNHGFGASGDDLVGLAEVLAGPSGTRYVFPEAPLDLGPAMPFGKAWWHIDMVALQMAMATGSLRNLTDDVPEGLAPARAQFRSLVDAVRSELSPTSLVVGGFSQGSMLATDFALHDEGTLNGLLLFSPTYFAEPVWGPRFSRAKDLPVFISHGRMDPVLPFAGADRLREALTKAGAEVTFVPFDGLHEIPAPAVFGAREFLRERLK
ncbi:MAG: dienelactone hydrolase family protein [Myxococcota bacterium]